MISIVPSKPTESFVFTSSVRDDVWHPRSDPKAYEWWHFDALSDNGREAILVTFLDNFIYSPRYNRASTETPDAQDSVHQKRFPAIAFTYFCEGTALYRTTVEYDESEMTASSDRPAVTIGNSFFRFEEADYGSGFTVVVNEELSRGRRIEAHLEWLSIESDLRSDGPPGDGRKHCWNMVTPRSDVTGKITIIGKNGHPTDVRHFRGTGYHDHKLDNRWLADTVRDWNWGRAHFADATAVFCRYRELGDAAPVSKLLIVRNGELLERNVDYEEQNFLRDKFGIRYPTRLRLISDDNMRLRIKPSKIIHSSFYFLRFLSEFTLTLQDGIPRTTLGISEFVAPRALKLRWINWLRRA